MEGQIDQQENLPQGQFAQGDHHIRGSRSHLQLYFDVEIVGDILYAFLKKECRFLTFEGDRISRQGEVLAALQAMGTNMHAISALQNAGRGNICYTL